MWKVEYKLKYTVHQNTYVHIINQQYSREIRFYMCRCVVPTGMCSCGYICVHIGAHICICIHVEATGQSQMSVFR